MSLIQTPPERFEDVPDYDYPYERVPVRDDGAAMAYVDVEQQGEGTPDETFLLRYGEHFWGFLYRKLIPTLSEHGRLVVPDMLGLGRSDKYTDPDAYGFDLHYESFERLLFSELDLSHLKGSRLENGCYHAPTSIIRAYPEWHCMTELTDEYAATDDLNQKYSLLRTEISRLRGRRDDIEFFDSDAVRSDLERLNETVAGDLVVFLANDFGRPRAYRPGGVEKDVQNEVREAILQNKYDDTNEDLNAIRRELLAAHPAIHKIIVTEHSEETTRYHLPEGSNESTNFVTVREMVGLVDYTTNSFQSEGLCETY